MAATRGCSLRECLDTTTHREFLIWKAWFKNEWNNPSRNDYYLMQIVATIKNILIKKKADLTSTDECKIEFTFPEPAKESKQKEYFSMVEATKSIWMAVTGYKKRK